MANGVGFASLGSVEQRTWYSKHARMVVAYRLVLVHCDARGTVARWSTPSGGTGAKSLGSERPRCRTTGPRRNGAEALGSQRTGPHGPRPRGHQRGLVSPALKTRLRTPAKPRIVREHLVCARKRGCEHKRHKDSGRR